CTRVIPQAVVLPGPVGIDAPTPHGLEGPFHADRAYIDVANDEADHEQGDRRMESLGNLHARVACPEEREHQARSRQSERKSPQRHAPEDKLLPGIELAGRRIGTADETAAALEPLPIETLEEVLPGPDRN